jgi:hypothetical protein
MRRSVSINKRQADCLRDALDHAMRQLNEWGCPPQSIVVLNFEHAEPRRVAAAFETLRRNHFTRWLRHHSSARVPRCYIWCLERVSRPHFGDHSRERSLRPGVRRVAA